MKMELGRNIRTLRLENRMTQEQMAEALGVSAGAVYKWESERSAPEVGMRVELAQLFEVSVDALLGYGWEKEGMGATAEHLRELIHHRRLDEGISYGEKALRKYPNSFEVVYRSAQLYFLSMKPERMLRAVELFRKALDLIDQNNDEKISIATIYTDIAYCLCVMGRKDEAVELLCRNNAGGMNDGHIGLLLAQMGGQGSRSAGISLQRTAEMPRGSAQHLRGVRQRLCRMRGIGAGRGTGHAGIRTGTGASGWSDPKLRGLVQYEAAADFGGNGSEQGR